MGLHHLHAVSRLSPERQTGVMMDFKDLLRTNGFDPDAREKIVLLRHRPQESKLATTMPWIVAERPDLFEVYQSVPGRPATAIRKAELVASFIGLRPGTAHFIGHSRRYGRD